MKQPKETRKPFFWKHKFWTPQKNKHRRHESSAESTLRDISTILNVSENTTTSNNNSTEGHQKPFILSTKAEPANRENGKYIRIRHDIMRSISAAITHIERLGGLNTKELYGEIEKDTFSSLKDEIITCKNQILKQYSPGYSIGVESISKVSNNCIVVSEALKLALKSCEPLVPLEMYNQVMKMKQGSDIERLLSSHLWPDPNRFLFILLLHHFGKLSMNDNINEKLILERLARDFSSILLREVRQPFRKSKIEKKKIRLIKTVINHISSEQRKGSNKYKGNDGCGSFLQSGDKNTSKPKDDKFDENEAPGNVIGMSTKIDEVKIGSTKVLHLNISSLELDEAELDTRIITSYIHYEDLVKRTRFRLQAASAINKRVNLEERLLRIHESL